MKYYFLFKPSTSYIQRHWKKLSNSLTVTMDLLYLTSFIKIAKVNWIVNIFWEVVENGYLDITVVWHESGNLAKFDIFNLDSFRFVISPVRFLTIGKLDFPQVRERICPIMAAVRKWEVQTELSGLPNHLQLTPRDGWISSLETFRCNIRTHLICFLQYHVQNYSEF